MRYRFPDPSVGAHVGTVDGWIAATDVDAEGAPGFVSERSGRPAELFHVRFDVTTCPFASQDLEGFELDESLLSEVEGVESGEEGSVDEEEALSETIRHVLKRGRAKKGTRRGRKG